MKSNLNSIKSINKEKTQMKKHLFFSTILIAISLTSCQKDKQQIPLNINDKLSFSGTFGTINSEDLYGTVILNISNGYYECLTSLPYGHGAGKIDVSNNTINFIDTLFFAIPAMYGPSYVLSGEHYYEFDGRNLKVWKEKNVGSVEYDLRISDSN